MTTQHSRASRDLRADDLLIFCDDCGAPVQSAADSPLTRSYESPKFVVRCHGDVLLVALQGACVTTARADRKVPLFLSQLEQVSVGEIESWRQHSEDAMLGLAKEVEFFDGLLREIPSRPRAEPPPITPAAPTNAAACTACNGDGYLEHPHSKSEILCRSCDGAGTRRARAECARS